MPREQRDLTIGAIIVEKVDWTNKEIIIQLDNREQQEQSEYNRLKVEFTGNGNRFAKSGSRDIQARIEREYAQDSKRYILQHIYYYNITISIKVVIAGKSIVQVDGRRDARSLWLGVGCILCLVSSELTPYGSVY